MKIRQGFVSNSSSSSFTCDVCGEEFHGWDASPFDDQYECRQCVSGHIFCEEEMVGPDLPEDYDWRYEDGVPAENCPICTFSVFAPHELRMYLLKEYKVPEAEVFAEVKAINKRRRVLKTDEYNLAVCKRFNLQEESLLEVVRGRFKTNTDFWKYINSKE